MAHTLDDQVRAYAGLIASLAAKVAGGARAKQVGGELDDYAQEGYIAVWQALERGVTPSAEIIEFRMRSWTKWLGRQTPLPYEAMLPLDDYSAPHLDAASVQAGG